MFLVIKEMRDFHQSFDETSRVQQAGDQEKRNVWDLLVCINARCKCSVLYSFNSWKKLEEVGRSWKKLEKVGRISQKELEGALGWRHNTAHLMIIQKQVESTGDQS